MNADPESGRVSDGSSFDGRGKGNGDEPLPFDVDEEELARAVDVHIDVVRTQRRQGATQQAQADAIARIERKVTELAELVVAQGEEVATLRAVFDEQAKAFFVVEANFARLVGELTKNQAHRDLTEKKLNWLMRAEQKRASAAGVKLEPPP